MRFIVAGTGYTGRRVLERLPAAATSGLSRSALAGHDVRIIDLDDGDDSSITLPASYALLYTIPPRPGGDGDPRLASLLGRLNPPPRRIVYLSTSGVYGDRGGAVTDECAPPNPSTARARRRLDAETLLKRWCEAHGTECVILRVPGIYGPGRLGVSRLRDGAAILRESDAGPGNRIHVDDLVRCAVAAMTGEAPAGIYNVSDGDHRSSSAFSTSVARLAGLPAPRQISRAEAQAEWSAKRLSFLDEARRLDTTKMRDVLGVTPRYADPEDGIRASLEDVPG